MGVLWQSILLILESVYRWIESKLIMMSDLTVGAIALTCRYGRYVKHKIFRKK